MAARFAQSLGIASTAGGAGLGATAQPLNNNTKMIANFIV